VQLEAENVTVSYYGDIYVLTGVSIEASDARLTCLIGPNGAGKSTLLKALFGYLKPKAGRIRLDGRDITGLTPYERVVAGIAYIAQEHAVFPSMTVAENLELGAWTFRDNRPAVADALERIYNTYPILRERRRVPAGRLSGGEQRMLEIARALMPDPQVLLIDEPTAGLAPLIAENIYAEVERLADQGRAVILVDQNVREAVPRSDYIYVMELGEVKLEGPAEDMGRDLRRIVASWVQV
jgi:branched-chain amino acid transport system ATP-binding protein